MKKDRDFAVKILPWEDGRLVNIAPKSESVRGQASIFLLLCLFISLNVIGHG